MVDKDDGDLAWKESSSIALSGGSQADALAAGCEGSTIMFVPTWETARCEVLSTCISDLKVVEERQDRSTDVEGASTGDLYFKSTGTMIRLTCACASTLSPHEIAGR